MCFSIFGGKRWHFLRDVKDKNRAKDETIRLTVSAHLSNGANPILVFQINPIKASQDHHTLTLTSKRVLYETIHLYAEYMRARLRALMDVTGGTLQRDIPDKTERAPSKLAPQMASLPPPSTPLPVVGNNTHIIQTIRTLPVIRAVELRAGKEMPADFCDGNIQAELAYEHGHVALAPCKNCEGGYGWFQQCVILPGYFFGGCASCRLYDQTSTCELYRQYRLKRPPQRSPLEKSISKISSPQQTADSVISHDRCKSLRKSRRSKDWAHESEQDTFQNIEAQLMTSKEQKSAEQMLIETLTSRVQELEGEILTITETINELKLERALRGREKEPKKSTARSADGEMQLTGVKRPHSPDTPQVFNTDYGNGSPSSLLPQNQSVTTVGYKPSAGLGTYIIHRQRASMAQAESFQTPVANMQRSSSSSAVLQAPITNIYQQQTSAIASHSHPKTPNNFIPATENSSTISLTAYNPFPATSANSGLYYSKSPLRVTHNGQIYSERTILAPMPELSDISGEFSGVKKVDGKTYKVYIYLENDRKKVKLVESPVTYRPEHLATWDGGDTFVKYKYLEEVVEEEFRL